MIRVLIADDHPIVRRGLMNILAVEADMTVTGAEDGRSALRAIDAGRFDVVVLDLNMPELSGLDVLRELKLRHPQLPALVLSALPESEAAVRVIRAGAAGYVSKEMAPEELVAAIRRVASGRRHIGPEVADLLVNSLTSGDAAPHASLSDREYRVMLLLSGGKTVSEIAAVLRLSVKTVSTYRTRILEKMKMRNNAELMRYSVERGLHLDPDR